MIFELFLELSFANRNHMLKNRTIFIYFSISQRNLFRQVWTIKDLCILDKKKTNNRSCTGYLLQKHYYFADRDAFHRKFDEFDCFLKNKIVFFE